MWYVLLDIVLFLVTLIVILLFRFQDRKDRQIYLVKTFMDRMRHQMEERYTTIKESFDKMSKTADTHETSVRDMLMRVDQSLEDLEGHADDLTQLQTYITHYHRILKELSMLTEKAEDRLTVLKGDLGEIDQIKNDLAEMVSERLVLKDAIDQLDEQFETVKGEKISEIEDSVSRELIARLTRTAAIGEGRIKLAQQSFEREYDNALSAFEQKMKRVVLEAQESIHEQLFQAEDQFAAVIAEKGQASQSPKESKELSSNNSTVSVNKSIPFPEPGLGMGLKDIDSEIASLVEEFDDTGVSDDSHEDVLPDSVDEPIADEASSYIFDILDEEIGEDVDEEEDLDKNSVIDTIEEEESGDELVLDEAEEDEIGDDSDSLEVEKDEDILDEIYYEDDDEIIFDDEEEDTGSLAEEPESVISPDKKAIVEEHLKEGFSINEIAELTDIPKGEIALIKELSDFSN